MLSIYDFIRKEEVLYQKPIQLEDGWDWSMKDHLRRSFLYKNSQFEENNEDRELRPNKNIVLAIRNVQNRTEGFDVKDIELYVNNADEYHKSFLVRKFHDKWVLENKIDIFIDDMVDSYGDYGGVLVRDTDDNRPEVIDLRSLAFCNQTDILAYPFAIKHIFSSSKLREMTKWGLNETGATIDIEAFLILCKEEDEEKKEIEIYEVHGLLPKDWMSDDRQVEESKKDLAQIQIVAYYKKQDGNEQGVTLFRKREPKLPFKFLPRDKIVGRALGRGGIEELLEPQVWTNWDEIKVTEMLEAASKMLPWTNDSALAAKHPTGMKDMDNMEFLQVGEGKQVGMLDTYPRNLAVFNDAITRWENHAKQLGAASEALLGESPSAGTPFKLYEAQIMEDKSMHRFRQGQLAVFMDEIYRDWTLPHIIKDIANDQSFIAELSADEMMSDSEAIMTNQVNEAIKEKILNGEIIKPEEIEKHKIMIKDKFFKSNKKFVKMLKDDIKGKLNVMTNIAGKQKNLALLTDKLVNVMRQFLTTPQIRQDPEMTKLLNVILESSGMSPIMFGSQNTLQLPQPNPQQLQQFQQPQSQPQPQTQ
jgi:hypothetical protein